MLKSFFRLRFLSRKNLHPVTNLSKNFTTSQNFYKEDKTADNKTLVIKDPFEDIENKNRNTYLDMVKIFINNDHIYRRHHVEFVYAALKNMEKFGVQKDLEVYKALIDVLPKGRFIPTNIIQSEFMHYPKQQQCIIDLLEQMEDNSVMPDYDMEDQLVNIFGKRGFPVRRFWRMMYWMPKFKNASPWPIPDPLPKDTYDLAKYAIERISSADVTSIVTVYQSADIPDSIDDTWIVSAQSPKQKELLEQHKIDDPIYVEGPLVVWIKEYPINYFILRGEPMPGVEETLDNDNVSDIKVSFFNTAPPIGKKMKIIPSVHEQEDGVLFSLCATGTSSKDSLLSWIRHLERNGNPNLAKIPVVFTLRTGAKEISNVKPEDNSGDDRKIEGK